MFSRKSTWSTRYLRPRQADSRLLDGGVVEEEVDLGGEAAVEVGDEAVDAVAVDAGLVSASARRSSSRRVRCALVGVLAGVVAWPSRGEESGALGEQGGEESAGREVSRAWSRSFMAVLRGSGGLVLEARALASGARACSGSFMSSRILRTKAGDVARRALEATQGGAQLEQRRSSGTWLTMPSGRKSARVSKRSLRFSSPRPGTRWATWFGTWMSTASFCAAITLSKLSLSISTGLRSSSGRSSGLPGEVAEDEDLEAGARRPPARRRGRTYSEC
jgi:hypothetical protein